MIKDNRQKSNLSLKSSKKRPRAVTDLFVFIQKSIVLEFIKCLEQIKLIRTPKLDV